MNNHRHVVGGNIELARTVRCGIKKRRAVPHYRRRLQRIVKPTIPDGCVERLFHSIEGFGGAGTFDHHALSHELNRVYNIQRGHIQGLEFGVNNRMHRSATRIFDKIGDYHVGHILDYDITGIKPRNETGYNLLERDCSSGISPKSRS